MTRKTDCLALALALIACGILRAETGSIAAPKRILVLNSYHKGYNWTDEQSESALEALKKLLPAATEDVVYMDWKRHPTRDTLDDLYATLRHRYASEKVDLIVTSDDAALSFAVSHRAEILWNAPIVFMGVFRSSDAALTKGEKGITGVYEEVDLEGCLRVASSIFPRSERLYVIHDGSETSLSMEKDILEILDRTGSRLDRIVLGGMVFSDLLETLSRIPPRSIVLLASYARDPNNLTMQPEEFARAMSASCPEPLFVLYSHMMGTGAFGGSLLDGRMQGQEAAKLAAAILDGAAAEDLPRVTRRTVRPGFDYAELKRFKVDERRLPRGSVVMGKPFSFFEAYWPIILATCAVLATLTTLVAVLASSVRRRKLAELALRARNEEIAAINADLERRVATRTMELSASNERLSEAIEQVKSSQEKAVESERLAALGHMTADIAHELNNPLGAVLSAGRSVGDSLDLFAGIFAGLPDLSAAEADCARKLLSLCAGNPREPEGGELRAAEGPLERRLEALGLGDPAGLAYNLAAIGYAGGEELDSWAREPGFTRIVEGADALRSSLQARDVVLEAAEQAAAVVSALKLYSRADEGGPPSLADIREEMENAIALFMGKVRKGVVLERRLEEVPPVLCWPDRLSRVWVNLIDNALYAMEYRGKLVLSTRLEGDTVVASVSDDGPGIPEPARSRIFEPFFTTKPRGEGSGLGLDICKRSVEEIGGSIGFETGAGGTTFFVRLPAAGAATPGSA